jgi:hypothetical protein
MGRGRDGHLRCQAQRTIQPTENIFTRDETGLVYLPTQLERTLQLYW